MHDFMIFLNLCIFLLFFFFFPQLPSFQSKEIIKWPWNLHWHFPGRERSSLFSFAKMNNNLIILKTSKRLIMLSPWALNKNLLYLCPNETHRAPIPSNSAWRPNPASCQLTPISLYICVSCRWFSHPKTMTALICQSCWVTLKNSQQESVIWLWAWWREKERVINWEAARSWVRESSFVALRFPSGCKTPLELELHVSNNNRNWTWPCTTEMFPWVGFFFNIATW